MSVNFFEWIRDGVRQSVLLGVGDAIEQLGSPADSDDVHPGVASFLASDKNDKGDKGDKKRLGASAASGTARKRLGRSLKDIDEPVAS